MALVLAHIRSAGTVQQHQWINGVFEPKINLLPPSIEEVRLVTKNPLTGTDEMLILYAADLVSKFLFDPKHYVDELTNRSIVEVVPPPLDRPQRRMAKSKDTKTKWSDPASKTKPRKVKG